MVEPLFDGDGYYCPECKKVHDIKAGGGGLTRVAEIGTFWAPLDAAKPRQWGGFDEKGNEVWSPV